MSGDSQLAANIPPTALQAEAPKTWIKRKQIFAGQSATWKAVPSIGKLSAKCRRLHDPARDMTRIISLPLPACHCASAKRATKGGQKNERPRDAQRMNLQTFYKSGNTYGFTKLAARKCQQINFHEALLGEEQNRSAIPNLICPRFVSVRGIP